MSPLCWGLSEAAVKLSARAGVSSQCLTEEETASELIWLLVEFTSSKVVELRALVSNWLLAGGCSQFLAMWLLRCGTPRRQ